MALDALIAEASKNIEAEVSKSVASKLEVKYKQKLTELDARLNDALAGADLRVVTAVGAKPSTLKGPKHRLLGDLITLCANRLPVLLVGPAGTGKTHAASQVAEALGLGYESISVGAQTSKSDLLGFIHANGGYVSTGFRRAYEHGGVFLLDELDAGNSNVLIALNAALSNGACAFPDGMVKKHKDFVLVASANTYGLGASREYVGRNQLDAATLDRFCVLDWPIDAALERKLCGHAKWLEVVRAIRKHAESEGLRLLVTPRASINGAVMLAASMPYKQVLTSTILKNVPADKQAYIVELADKVWNGDAGAAGGGEAFAVGSRVRHIKAGWTGEVVECAPGDNAAWVWVMRDAGFKGSGTNVGAWACEASDLEAVADVVDDQELTSSPF